MMLVEKTVITSDGAALATEALGEPGAPAILLSMGATASMAWWPAEFCEGLAAAGFRVIRYDHRDTGRSTTGSPCASVYTVSDMVDDIFAIMDAHDLARAHLAGMSLGGYLAQLAALRHPDRVDGLVLIASEPVGGVDEALPAMSSAIVDAFAGLAGLDWTNPAAVEGFMLEIARLSAGEGRQFDRDAAVRRIRIERTRARDMRSAFNHATLEMGEIGAPRIQDVERPILVVHGGRDPVLPLANGQAIARHARSSEILVLEEAGHELDARDIGVIVPRIAAFLRRTDAG